MWPNVPALRHNYTIYAFFSRNSHDKWENSLRKSQGTRTKSIIGQLFVVVPTFTYLYDLGPSGSAERRDEDG
jgi:hypothetical protein